jgi:hypothetical protein
VVLASVDAGGRHDKATDSLSPCLGPMSSDPRPILLRRKICPLWVNKVIRCRECLSSDFVRAARAAGI